MKHFAVFLLAGAAFAQSTVRIPMAEFRDRVKGGWAGQMIGVSYGAPTEFRFNEVIIPKEQLPQWSPEKITNSLNQDDLYVDMTFAKVLDDKGLDATTEDFGEMFRNARYALWHANLSARRNLKRGVPAKLAGHPDYNVHADDIDFQIESDFIGLMAPGMPRSATDIAMRAGRVMNYGEGLYGGVFVSCMYSAAFFEKSPRAVVEAGLRCLPPQSKYHKLIGDVLAWAKAEPKDWESVWRQIEKKWNNAEPCPEGAMRPFNIDAALNGAYIALGLLYGDGEMNKTIEVSTRAGQDSDCNPSSAAGILGVMLGYERIPDHWKSHIPSISKEKFRYTDFTFESIVDSTVTRAVKLTTRQGGKQDGDNLAVKTQAAKAAPFEQWKGRAAAKERIAVPDARWSFAGAWKQDKQTIRNTERHLRTSGEKGAEAVVTFEGTGVVVSGPFLPTCGKAEFVLDGKAPKVSDCYPDEDVRKLNDSMFHAFGLSKGKHTLRIRVLGERIFESKGTEIALNDVIVFE
ncbi:MAG: ADP-ribosylglycohydrolase family protein [Bryobacterales bacterium]|nr:ADP-ribosylglycohydrolase family protein [Bryobacterales bacterium]